MPERTVIGWDIGGAHAKACLLQGGEVLDVAQWPCALWMGMDRLDAVLQAARQRWAGLAEAQHAVTMTGEMVDLFADREDGVRKIAAELARALPAPDPPRLGGGPGAVHFFAGDAGWCRDAEVPALWNSIASANWLATARHAAQCVGTGLLMDIGSTTTDLIAFRNGRVLTHSRTDAQRLASGELVYHGVVRTPLCAVAQRIDWLGTPHNVMNELFATTADVYRLTGELNPAHDLHPSADNADKELDATRQRLARMIGLDRRDGSPGEWLDFARSWRAVQVGVLGGEMRRVMETHELAHDAVIVSAGCGDFLVRDVVASARAGTPQPWTADRHVAYGRDVVRARTQAGTGRAAVQDWAQVCAPCVAVATLFDMDPSVCGSSRSAAA
ncbi:hydantoinase/oxoprolinase family protein [Variovorax sp. J22P240]|uniref:hydantoinase/oxoprolinase family protein n=1 Tax=unclassified Variovorax TaxID=663243 RepID=UPI002574BBA5|nr:MULTISPECIES: hydantoinase/oxoprolinase family protein [unclassified Variovorax]MDL9997877.1 hydantoinase/oxoprolinase family protein [Variovorax sp. J22P240]MDM0049468.1 hydantoinase/oxoprolinase family protein [Variovorax sp. J22R115]